MTKNLFLFILYFGQHISAVAQPCTPQGDQNTYGTNNVWIGYVYDNQDFTGYLGYVNEGNISSPNFNQNFGGSFAYYPTNGCTLYTESFTIRYKLNKTFSAGSYTFTVSGDDRVRLSLDGGATWLINSWNYNSYLPTTVTLSLNGNYNLVLDYLEGAHQNRVYFNVSETCVAPAVTETYGAENVWNGYYFSGVSFDTYKGATTTTTGANLAFSQNFGGPSTNFTTSNCPVFTDFFSVRYKMRHTFPTNAYTFGVSGDDKYRLSLDGGATWIIDRWNFDDGNSTRYYTANLSGTYNMVLEYYEKDASNFIEFTSTNAIILPLRLESFSGRKINSDIFLNWKIADPQTFKEFEVERSSDGNVFYLTGKVSPSLSPGLSYTYNEKYNLSGPVYYRIKVTDLQGKYFYSKVITIHNSVSTTRVYPTVVTNQTVYLNNERSLGNASILICDLTGRVAGRKLLGQIMAKQTSSIYLDDLKLSKGAFILQIFDGNEVIATERLLVR